MKKKQHLLKIFLPTGEISEFVVYWVQKPGTTDKFIIDETMRNTMQEAVIMKQEIIIFTQNGKITFFGCPYSYSVIDITE